MPKKALHYSPIPGRNPHKNTRQYLQRRRDQTTLEAENFEELRRAVEAQVAAGGDAAELDYLDVEPFSFGYNTPSHESWLDQRFAQKSDVYPMRRYADNTARAYYGQDSSGHLGKDGRKSTWPNRRPDFAANNSEIGNQPFGAFNLDGHVEPFLEFLGKDPSAKGQQKRDYVAEAIRQRQLPARSDSIYRRFEDEKADDSRSMLEWIGGRPVPPESPAAIEIPPTPVLAQKRKFNNNVISIDGVDHEWYRHPSTDEIIVPNNPQWKIVKQAIARRILEESAQADAFEGHDSEMRRLLRRQAENEYRDLILESIGIHPFADTGKNYRVAEELRDYEKEHDPNYVPPPKRRLVGSSAPVYQPTPPTLLLADVSMASFAPIPSVADVSMESFATPVSIAMSAPPSYVIPGGEFILPPTPPEAKYAEDLDRPDPPPTRPSLPSIHSFVNNLSQFGPHAPPMVPYAGHDNRFPNRNPLISPIRVAQITAILTAAVEDDDDL